MKEIEILRVKLYGAIEIHGIGSKEVLEVSQQLDQLIIEEQRVKLLG